MNLSRRQFVAGLVIIAVGHKTNHHKRRHANIAPNPVAARAIIGAPITTPTGRPFTVGVSLVGGLDVIGGLEQP